MKERRGRGDEIRMREGGRKGEEKRGGHGREWRRMVGRRMNEGEEKGEEKEEEKRSKREWRLKIEDDKKRGVGG